MGLAGPLFTNINSQLGEAPIFFANSFIDSKSFSINFLKFTGEDKTLTPKPIFKTKVFY
jgi:hypothetical protein